MDDIMGNYSTIIITAFIAAERFADLLVRLGG
jgi:hypothetical protein